MSVEPRRLARSLLNATGQIGIERGVDLVLNVLFVRWLTLQVTDAQAGDREWSSLVAAGHQDLVENFARLAIFRQDERTSAEDSAGYLDSLQRVVSQVNEAVRDDASDPFTLIAATFDETLESLANLGKQAGEADTPRSVAGLLAELTVRPGDSVLDPACGNGTCLLVAAKGQSDVGVSGFDISARASRRASMRLLVHGVETRQGFGVGFADAFTETAPGNVDVVLAQPPWGATFSPEQQDRIDALSREFSYEARPVRGPKGDMPWLLLAIDALREDGRAAVVLPNSSTFNRFQETHQELLNRGVVEAVIALPSGVFTHTAIPTVVWLLRAPTATSSADSGNRHRSILMLDATTFASVQSRGRLMVDEDARSAICAIVETHRLGESVDCPTHIARRVPVDELDLRRGLSPRAYLTAPPDVAVTAPSPERKMLTAVGLGNFKAFGPLTNVPIAPLTFLYGANSSGKSSIIQALLLLQQSIGTDRLVTQGAAVNAGSFGGILNRHQAEALSISLSYGVIGDWIPPDGTADPVLPRTASWTFASSPDGQGRLTEVNWAFGDYAIPMVCTNEDQLFRLDLESARPVFEGIAEGTLLYPFDSRHGVAGDESEEKRRLQSRVSNARRAIRILRETGIDELAMRGTGLLPTAEVSNLRVGAPTDRDSGITRSYVQRTARLAGGVSAEIAALLGGVVWLGPLRSAPQRVYDRANTTSSPGDGKHVAMYLFDHASVVEQANDWLRRLEIPYALDVVPIAAGDAASRLVGDLVAISLTDQRSGVTVTPADVGFGISQALPIVVELLARRQSVIAIEQPETHLHPRLQARVADLFIDAVQEGGRANQLIVETHSEHLMLRVQRRIREGALDPALVAVLYVDQDVDGNAHIKRLRLNGSGEFLDDWPDGFFDDRLEEVFGGF